MSNLCAYFYSGSADNNLLGISSTGIYDNRSNQQLFEQVLGIEKLLAVKGVEPGDKVLIFAQASLHALAVILACFHRGAVAVLLPPFMSIDEMQTALDRHSAVLIYLDEDSQKKAPDLESSSIPVLSHSSLNSVYEEVALKSKLKHQVVLNFDDKPEDMPALRVQSSGSTGKPKIIEYTHGKLQSFFYYHNIIYEEYFYSVSSASPLISVFPFSHLAGIAMPLQGMSMGQATCVIENFESTQLLTVMSSTKAHFIALVPSMYTSLLEDKQTMESMDFSNLEYCVCLGEATAPKLMNDIKEKFKAQVLCAYGLSECLPGLAHQFKKIEIEPIPKGSCGKNIFGELMLVNQDGQQQKHFGKLCVRNETVFACYKHEKLNQEVLQDGWFVTQDLFYRDSKGFYFHRGRADSLFTYHGKTIAPAEIENIALTHSDVSKACCVPLLDASQATVPGLIVEVEQNRNFTVSTLMNYLLQQGKSHLIPKQLQITAAIPLIGPGKLDRMACKVSLQQALDIADI